MLDIDDLIIIKFYINQIILEEERNLKYFSGTSLIKRCKEEIQQNKDLLLKVQKEIEKIRWGEI